MEPDEDDPAVAEPTISRPWYSDPILRLTLLIPIVAGLAMSVYLYRERLKAKFVAELKSIESSARQAVAMGRMREAFDQYEKVTVLARDASDEEALTLARKAEAEHARLKPLVQAQIEREAAELARKEQEARAALAIKAKIEAEAQSKQAAVKAFETEQEQLAKTTANLKGGAWVIKGAGQSDILRGLEIYVIRQQMLKKDLADPIRSVQTDSDFKDMGLYIKELPVQPDDTVVDLGRVYQAIRNVQRPYTDEYNMNAMRNEVSWPRFVLEAKVEQSTTNIDGKYELKGLKGGRYFLYARSISSFSAIEWLQPLEVSESGEVSADFYNSTAKLILNKND